MEKDLRALHAELEKDHTRRGSINFTTRRRASGLNKFNSPISQSLKTKVFNLCALPVMTYKDVDTHNTASPPVKSQSESYVRSFSEGLDSYYGQRIKVVDITGRLSKRKLQRISHISGIIRVEATWKSSAIVV